MLRVILTFIMLCTIINFVNANQFEIKKTNNILFLELNLNEGDYIYWKHSGQVGKSSAISLDGLSNIKSYDIKWPFPTIKIENNNISYIYENRVSIPIVLNIDNINHQAQAKIDIDYAICNKEECRPLSQTIEESFSALKEEDYANYNDYKITYLEIKEQEIIFGVNLNKEFEANPEFLIEPKDNVFFTTTRAEPAGALEYIVFAKVSGDYKKLLGKDVTLYSNININPHHFIFENTNKTAGQTNLAMIFAIALLAGFILNFMPCVLPVLSLKLLSIVNNRHKSTGAIATILGILTSFATLSLISISLKAVGQEFILGANFQQPVFIISIIIILTFLVSSMLDKIQLNLPYGLINYLNNFEFQGHFMKNFSLGVLSTILSTPCTAPFLGSVMLVALTSTNQINLALFLTLGVGFSLPYFLILFFPSILNIIPKTGSWMVTLKKILSIPLAATIMWFITIIAAQMGLKAAVVTLGLVVVLKFILENDEFILKNIIVKIIALCITLLCFFTLPNIAFQEKIESEHKMSETWHKFNKQELQAFIDSGNLVFVDISADWCATCKYNKILLLDRIKFINLANKYDIILVRADYTRGNEEIQSYIKSFNHYGIPLNVVYGPKVPGGIKLPTILKYEDIEKAIIAAK